MVVASIKAALHEVEHSILIEEEGFRDIVKRSRVDFRGPARACARQLVHEAEEARALGLVLDVI